MPSLAGAHVVVTGAAGFIGQHLLRGLAASGAAQVSVPRSVEDPLTDASINALGTIAVLESCRKAGVRRVVYRSAAAVYGVPAYLPVDEAHPTRPISPYGLSKLTGERYCLLYGDLYGMSTVALCYFNVYGPGQPVGGGYAGVITLFVDRVRRGLPLPIEGDGSQTRVFVRVDDIVWANLAAGASEFSGVLNVASVAAIDAARHALGFEPDVTLDVGLRRLIRASPA